MTIEIRKEWEGRMGNDMTPSFDGYVDGVLVVIGLKRKWLTKAVCEAIVRGDIESSGDTVARFSKWAMNNDRAAFERMPERI